MKFQLWETFFAVETEVSILAQCSHEHKKIYQILFGNSKYEQICIVLAVRWSLFDVFLLRIPRYLRFTQTQLVSLFCWKPKIK